MPQTPPPTDPSVGQGLARRSSSPSSRPPPVTPCPTRSPLRLATPRTRSPTDRCGGPGLARLRRGPPSRQLTSRQSTKPRRRCWSRQALPCPSRKRRHLAVRPRVAGAGGWRSRTRRRPPSCPLMATRPRGTSRLLPPPSGPRGRRRPRRSQPLPPMLPHAGGHPPGARRPSPRPRPRRCRRQPARGRLEQLPPPPLPRPPLRSRRSAHLRSGRRRRRRPRSRGKPPHPPRPPASAPPGPPLPTPERSGIRAGGWIEVTAPDLTARTGCLPPHP